MALNRRMQPEAADAFRARRKTEQLRRFGAVNLPVAVQVEIANHAVTTGMSEKAALADLIALHGSTDLLIGYCIGEHRSAVVQAKRDLKFEERMVSEQPFTDTNGSVYKRTQMVQGGGTGTGGKKR